MYIYNINRLSDKTPPIRSALQCDGFITVLLPITLPLKLKKTEKHQTTVFLFQYLTKLYKIAS